MPVVKTAFFAPAVVILLFLASTLPVHANTYHCEWQNNHCVAVEQFLFGCGDGYQIGQQCLQYQFPEGCNSPNSTFECIPIPPLPTNSYRCIWTPAAFGFGGSCTTGENSCDTENNYGVGASCETLDTRDACINYFWACESDVLPPEPEPEPGPPPTLYCTGEDEINTAIGCISITDLNRFIIFLLTWSIGLAGAVFLILTLYASFIIITSSGNPRRLRLGHEIILSALAGLIMLIFSVFILKVIGVDIFGFLL